MIRFDRFVAIAILTLGLSACSGVGQPPDVLGASLTLRNVATPPENAISCLNTGSTSLFIRPGGGAQRLNWERAEDKHLKLRQLFVFGANDDLSDAQIEIENSTCNYFDAPQPPSGTVVLYTATYTACSGSCPQTITFTTKPRRESTFTSAVFHAGNTYSVYFYANGSSTPISVSVAQLDKTWPLVAQITFATPFKAPLQLQPAYNFYIEVVQTN